jgi:hypothetical protein
MEPSRTARETARDLAHHPVRTLVRYWNWKSALLSSISRAAIFLAVNLPAGTDAAVQAMLTELVFRAVASGVLGSVTQAFSRARPGASTTLTALVFIPALGHAAEYLVHRTAGTARLEQSIAASIAFSVLTTAFNLFAMRRGALIVGPGRRSIASDLRRLPALVVAFVATIARPVVSAFGGRRRNGGTWQSRRCI